MLFLLEFTVLDEYDLRLIPRESDPGLEWRELELELG